MKKRVLASLLTLCLLVGLLPTTVLAKGGNPGNGNQNNSSEIITLAFYYRYSNEIPIPAHAGETYQEAYGPSGNDMPLRTAEVDLDALFRQLGDNASSARNTWENDEYITAASCGYENNADWWDLVVSCMTNVDDQTYFKEGVGRTLYQGYVIRRAASTYPYHCDGILLEEPPLYLVEIEDVTNHHYVGTLSYSEGDQTTSTMIAVSDVQTEVFAYLEEQYGEGTINWNDSYYDGIFTGEDASYQVELDYKPVLNTYGTIQYAEMSDGYYLATVKVTLDEFFTVTYDANSGQGPVPVDEAKYSGYGLVPVQFTPEPTRDGYDFLGWDRRQDATQPEFTKEGLAQKFNITGNTTLYAIWERNVPTYTLTYDANGGTGGPDPVTFTAAQKGYALESVNVPLHDRAADGRSVVFAGWTTTKDEHIYRAGESAPETVTAVDVNGPVTVYALWGYSEDGDSIADVNEIVIKPADITIYTGGEGYDASAVVDVDGDELFDATDEEYTGLPVPGFYITLPTALNKQLRQDANTDPVNLTRYLSFEGYDPDKEPTGDTWSLTLYNPESENNIAFEKFIYRIVADSDSADVRLLIQDEETGDAVPSDRFTLSKDNLYQEYTISIYPGDVDQDRIKAVIDLAGADDYGIFIDQGTLVVRGVNEQDPTKQILSAEPETAVNDITAVKDAEATFYTNESKIEVGDPTKVELLADSVLNDSDTLSKLREAAADSLNKAGVTIGANTIFDFQYLDLVDTSNGNAYVTTNKSMTIYWPIPANAAEDTDYYVVHFNGLDRNYNVSQLDSLIGNTTHKVDVYSKDDTINPLTIETIGNQKYVKFSTSTFSPFALVYETKTTPSQETVTVTFKVVNGTWSDGTSSNKTATVTKGGSLTTSQIPTGMKPNSGYEGGSWDTTPNTNRTLDGDVTYTYTFTKSGDTEPEDEDCILYFDSNGGTEFKKIDNGNHSFRINPYSDSEYGQHIPSRPGYRFTGWYRDEDLENRISESTKINVNSIMTIYAGWERTSVPSMLNGDDHYAYIQGYADGTVRPNANITRAQVATIFFRLLDEDVRSDYLTTYNTFPDVNADYWANTAISTMASLGVINGRNSGLFDPDAYITRAEFAAICARFDDSNVSGFDSFTDTFGHWAEEEIGRAAALGWIQGYDDGTFRPNQYITRAQAVTMINRVLCRLPEDEDDLLPGMSIWTDCREGDWCYLAIQEATNSHDYVTKDRVYETWTDLNRAPDWSRYE